VFLTIRKRLCSERMFSKGIEVPFDEKSLKDTSTFKLELTKYFQVLPEKMILAKYCFSKKVGYLFLKKMLNKKKKKLLDKNIV